MSKAIIILIVLAAIGGGGYYYYSTQQVVDAPNPTQLTTTGNLNPNGKPKDGFDSAEALKNIQKINLDYSFFKESPVFLSLIPFGKDIRGPIPGRKNPFAPLSEDGVSSGSLSATITATSTSVAATTTATTPVKKK